MNEIIEDYRQRREQGVIFKVDFEKGFDQVDWNFLDKVLEKRGFGFKWRFWIWNCTRSANYSIFFNGKPRIDLCF